ncbi:MAG: ATP-grasp domain-containing protein [Dactylosporangium sp.]|nr:acetyl-CoA carboxylase biotin carboxylase subunit family protein [Dactylosporangium sp.]NNJ63250.1 ATP-grasp domain-containing protein [Dactylosporangium sp.]
MIRRVLVADRGAFARRAIATCRAIGVETVAVFTEPDSLYAAEADFAVSLPAPGPDPHLGQGFDVPALLAAAARCGADAIHPGRGPLATDQAFATDVLDAGLTWIGPDPKILKTMASKLDARAMLAGTGLPVLPATTNPEEVSAFPVIVKPVAGRSGRGMRVVRSQGPLAEAFASARRDAALTFGDGTVFCERFIDRARSIEVQVIADAAGTIVPLGERECSIQRHRQKILEEAPSAAVDPGLRAELFAAAVTAARAIGLVGAATVEFLLAPSGDFYFLTINARIGAGHAVTECVFGIDLVRLQLLVAEGGTLPFTAPPPMRGHAIAARLAAEDPAYDWRPSAGTVHRFEVPGVLHAFGPLLVPGLRLDAAIADGAAIRGGGDPALGTVVAWTPTRHETARVLSTALAHARLHGVITNRDLLVRVLRHPLFGTGEVGTAFLDQHPEVFAPLLSSLEAVHLSCLAAALAGSARRKAAVPTLASLPTGWRNGPSRPQTAAYQGPAGLVEVDYQFDRAERLTYWAVRSVERNALDAAAGEIGGEADGSASRAGPALAVVSATPERVELDIGGIRLAFSVHMVAGDPAVCYVDSPEGSVALTELPRFV